VTEGRGAARRLRVIVCDDHELVRRGLKSFLSTVDDIEVVGEAADAAEAVRLADGREADVALVDLLMPEGGGLAAVEGIRRVRPDCQVVILTSYASDELVMPVLRAGAVGYLLKTARAEDVLEAVRRAARGQSSLEPGVAARLLDAVRRPPGPLDQLTARELDVLSLVAEGRSNQEIADRLFIGVKTVKTHVSNLLGKLGLEDRTQLAVFALRHGVSADRDGGGPSLGDPLPGPTPR
jgi:NarL family two-component system response regulator LiaR